MPPSVRSTWPARDAAHLLVRGEQMAALEQQLFSSGLPVEALMEKAALAVSRRLQEPDWWPCLQRYGALVLVGPGHNGGDGLVVARELHLAGITVRLWSPFEQHKPLTAAHRRHARWLGIPELGAAPAADDPAVWIDALFGIGQHRPPGEALEELLAARQQQRPGLLIALDGPTGLCADRGCLLGRQAACAALSLGLGLIKQGWLQQEALAWVGQLERVDLGLPASLLALLPRQQPLALHPADLSSAPWPPTDPAAAKYERGRLLTVVGSPTYRGAALLALQGASATGLGSLRAALPAAIAERLWSVQPHVVVEAALPGNARGGLDLQTLSPTALERLDALLLGPGLGPGDRELESDTWLQLQALPGLLVLDADGLNRLAGSGAQAWLRGRGGPTWLTPHRAEFDRLFPALADREPLDAVAEAAAAGSGAHPCSVLLKGPRSCIASADGRRWQLAEASAMAARAGLGDVLAGYAAGLGARAGAAAAADGSLLATAALAHASAAIQAGRTDGAGGAEPGAVARQLARITPETTQPIT